MKKLLKIISILCLILILASGCGAPAATPEETAAPAGQTLATPRVVLAELFTGDW